MASTRIINGRLVDEWGNDLGPAPVDYSVGSIEQSQIDARDAARLKTKASEDAKLQEDFLSERGYKPGQTGAYGGGEGTASQTKIARSIPLEKQQELQARVDKIGSGVHVDEHGGFWKGGEVTNIFGDEKPIAPNIPSGTSRQSSIDKMNAYKAETTYKSSEEMLKDTRAVDVVKREVTPLTTKDTPSDAPPDTEGAGDTPSTGSKVQAYAQIAKMGADMAGVEGDSNFGGAVGGAAQGAGMASALLTVAPSTGPAAPYIIAAAAVIGAFQGVMGARAARKEKERLEKESKRKEAAAKEKADDDRRARIFIAKGAADANIHASLQQAISAALSRDVRVNIRT